MKMPRCFLAAVVSQALVVPALAQSGATGGSLGKSGKSVSGSAAPVLNQRRSSRAGAKAAPKSCAQLLTAQTWIWGLGESVSFVASDANSGRMSSPLNSGTWKCNGPRSVTLHWNLLGFVDQLTISSTGTRLTGTNNLGQAVSFNAR